MKKTLSCKFCNIINGIYKYPNIDRPILESDYYLAVASIGAMVNGWTLVMPKEHKCSMRESYADEKFYHLFQQLVKIMASKYGRLVAFEHGSNREGSPTGCGINHAHLHFVPLEISLKSEIITKNLHWKKCKITEVESISKNNEYLLYLDIDSGLNLDNQFCLIHLLENPVSQFFRKIIANHIGRSEIFDYKTYPFFNKSQKTREILTSKSI